MNPENILLNKSIKKATHSMIPLKWNIQKREFIATEEGALGISREEQNVDWLLKEIEFLLGVMQILWN